MLRSGILRRRGCAALVGILIAASTASTDEPLFYYGRIVDVNPGSRVIAVRGDDNSKRRLQVTPATEIHKHVDRPVAAGFEDLTVGARVRVLVGWAPTTNPTIRQAVAILIYD